MKPKSAAQRKQAERDRYRDAGLRLVQVPIHPGDHARFRRYVAALNKRRGF